MSELRIPKTFRLMGQEYRVSLVPDLVAHCDSLGEAHYMTNEIRLQSAERSAPLHRDQIEDCFCHELVHHVFQMAGEAEMCKNERLVAVVAGLLHQALTTAEGDLLADGKRNGGAKR